MTTTKRKNCWGRSKERKEITVIPLSCCWKRTNIKILNNKIKKLILKMKIRQIYQMIMTLSTKSINFSFGKLENWRELEGLRKNTASMKPKGRKLRGEGKWPMNKSLFKTELWVQMPPTISTKPNTCSCRSTITEEPSTKIQMTKSSKEIITCPLPWKCRISLCCHRFYRRE